MSDGNHTADKTASDRPPAAQRRFVSKTVDAYIDHVAGKMRDGALARMFRNCLPNTLDTTVYYRPGSEGAPSDTFVVTGDIHAMWLRDSAHQVLPYVRFAREDATLQDMLRGVIHRHAKSVLVDPYANAFTDEAAGTGAGPNQDDATSKLGFLNTRVPAMSPALFERKYSLDSLCAVLKLAAAYWNATGDATPFTSDTWVAAVERIVDTVATETAGTAQTTAPAYMFQRASNSPLNTLIEYGVGPVSAPTGMSKSYFRPSDDASTFAFHVPSNAFAVVALRGAARVLRDAAHAPALAARAEALASQIDEGIRAHALVQAGELGRVFAYEVDGFGGRVLMDDANVPSLLSLPYLGYVPADAPEYVATRALVWSDANPYFNHGAAGVAAVGSPHNGRAYVWPMSIAMRALTSTSDAEIAECLRHLVTASAGTGFMHESFNVASVEQFTRPWFGWANSLFGELIMRLADERPHLLF